jgi:tRNA-(ms[2]io[6]A)-hydroxylase
MDHADCERKASSSAMSFIAKYPNRLEMIPDLIETAVEELEHFQEVYKLMEQRGVQLAHKMPEDPYIKQLMKNMKSSVEERFLDRLLIASVVETRGAERFKIVAEHMEDEELQKFYKMLWISEAKHGHIFVKMALNYFPEKEVYARLHWWMDKEGEIVDNLPFRAALH